MRLGIVETNDPERIWNGFRLAITALDADHTAEVFLLDDGVEAPEEDDLRPRATMMTVFVSSKMPKRCLRSADSSSSTT